METAGKDLRSGRKKDKRKIVEVESLKTKTSMCWVKI